MLHFNSKYKDEIFETVLENAYHCFVIVDAKGLITYMNKTYCDFIEVNRDEIIGKHVEEVIENTRMHIVARTGIEEIADLQYIRGNHMIANRIPVYANGEIVGAVGTVLFRDTKEWMKMNSHIKDLMLEVEHYRSQLNDRYGVTYSLHDIVGSSPRLSKIKNQVKKVAPGDVTILLRGESGTGKELFAHSIHHLSERNQKPFIKVNCAAIPEHLLESELFGYTEGAFTGAKKGGKLGKFQLADGGTIFLDEIGDMPLNAQVKILRVLQEGEVEAIGSVQTQKIDVRVVAATNQSLEKLIQEGRFREDLFYRINVIQLHIPSLNERADDIRVLAKYILTKVTNRSGKRVLYFDPQVLEFLTNYSWPGNIRELENVIESAVHLSTSETITMEDLPDHLKKDIALGIPTGSLKETLDQAEKQALTTALHQSNGDKIEAAKRLKIGKSSFYDKLKKYNL
ncbi:sigma 54-interacting transcriptional regulator [Virgibacillus halodenitrificans]|uniref:sigma-54 interaction domain-containing protein n=1 Tax=Virgibacillus halodenitrificans TaxID=1482 RepID=UPI00045CAEEE|nr:sigma 54-interacting transcriptional regulator [Virgibacillus halodenitrificans]MCG1026887.1 sigma 54-interacting transcriptional regulator [Virgibacillus halodenitrificans]CDQ30791.1 Transcriptional regulatory protein ZraR [Virgibacillus halodenitrificans]